MIEFPGRLSQTIWEQPVDAFCRLVHCSGVFTGLKNRLTSRSSFKILLLEWGHSGWKSGLYTISALNGLRPEYIVICCCITSHPDHRGPPGRVCFLSPESGLNMEGQHSVFMCHICETSSHRAAGPLRLSVLLDWAWRPSYWSLSFIKSKICSFLTLHINRSFLVSLLSTQTLLSECFSLLLHHLYITFWLFHGKKNWIALSLKCVTKINVPCLNTNEKSQMLTLELYNRATPKDNTYSVQWKPVSWGTGEKELLTSRFTSLLCC